MSAEAGGCGCYAVDLRSAGATGNIVASHLASADCKFPALLARERRLAGMVRELMSVIRFPYRPDEAYARRVMEIDVCGRAEALLKEGE